MRQLIILLMLLYHAWHLNAQTSVPILDRRVTVKITKQPLGKVLNIISETANFNFSYGNHIKVNRNVSIHAENRTVREVLDQLFNNEISYQQIGNHLILQKRVVQKASSNIQPNSGKPVKYNYTVSGYIRDLYSGNGIINVSIYEKQTLTNTFSGDFGYYELALTSKEPKIAIHYSVEGFGDTIVELAFSGNGLGEININLKSKTQPPPVDEFEEEETNKKHISPSVNDSTTQLKKDTAKTKLAWFRYPLPIKKIKVNETQFGKWFINKYQRLSEKNIHDSFYSEWQVTLLPPIGSNGKLSGLVTNKFSFNILIGYNGGVDGAEFGGLLNIVKHDMHGAQFCGFGNVTGGNVEGAQFAGFMNHNLGDMIGFQGAGFYNFNHGYTNGMQGAGFMNVNLRDMEGVQGAGFMNINGGNLDGVQAAGFANMMGSTINGIQGAGFTNISFGKVNGMQLAGFINIANRVDGGQAAGFINVARHVRGFQIGIINIADSVEGVTLGIVNFIRNGVHQIEICKNENNYGISYRSGTHALYSSLILDARLPVADTGTLIGYGWGLGTSFKLTKNLRLTLDATSQQLTYNFNSEYLNLHTKLGLNAELKLFKGFSVFGGASLNNLISDVKDPHFESTFRNYGTNAFYRVSRNDYDRHMWVGYQFGVRLF